MDLEQEQKVQKIWAGREHNNEPAEYTDITSKKAVRGGQQREGQEKKITKVPQGGGKRNPGKDRTSYYK